MSEVSTTEAEATQTIEKKTRSKFSSKEDELITELVQSGTTLTSIVAKLAEAGFTRTVNSLRYYAYRILPKKGISIPKKARGRKPKVAAE